MNERRVENGQSRAVEEAWVVGEVCRRRAMKSGRRERGPWWSVERGAWSVEWSVGRRQGKRAAGSNFDGGLTTIKRAIWSSYRDGKGG